MNKYKAIPTIVDGIRFASKGEANRYSELKLLERSKIISGLELQPKFDLRAANGEKVCTYTADFRYIDNGLSVVEDFKGVQTPLFKLKRRLFQAEYGIQLRITGRAG